MFRNIILLSSTLFIVSTACVTQHNPTETRHINNYRGDLPPTWDDQTLSFYDFNADGSLREIRNDLNGKLNGMVQFVQSHSVDPSGNEEKHMPRVTSEREALLLYTPSEHHRGVNSIEVTVFLMDEEQETIVMRRPEHIFPADRPEDSQDPRPDVVYSKRAWSAVIPWNYVKPGLELVFQEETGVQGILEADAIEMAPPSELIINNIRIGLLTDPPVSDDHYMLLEPEKAGVDYFQTAPVARMTIAKYEDITLDRVMVATGEIYDTASRDEGGVYSGDMRENVAKSTFSVGINLANWGVTSSGMLSQHQPQLTQTVVTHHAQGEYDNGTQLHGLSGGNGMLTLIRSTGNEFSHEIGHHYGLGHYPGRDGEDDFWTTHHHDSGWGYIAHRQKMRANIHWTDHELSDGSTNVPNFKDTYRFSRDAMSGGDIASQHSVFTHYTGYSTQMRIQPSLNRPVFSSESSTGYKIWNEENGTMDVHHPEIPESEFIWFNSEDGHYRTPVKHGVEVYTLLGGYDPETQIGLLYPPARSNWGNLFDLPGPEFTSNERQCWLQVDYEGGNTREIALSPDRMGSNANKLHVQVGVEEQPRRASLYCKPGEGEKQLLSEVEFPSSPEAMDRPVVIGQEKGFNYIYD